MNVLIICTEKLPVPAIRGGAIQTYIDGILPTLKEKHHITVLGRSDDALPDEEVKEGIRYIRVEGGFFPIYRENVVQYLKTASEPYDLIHIFNRPRLVSSVRELYPSSKIILSMHNDMFKPEKIEREEGISAIYNVDKIITISNYIGQAIVELFPEAESKVHTIYSGVDLNRFVPVYSAEGKKMREKMREEHGLESKKVILYAGRLSPNKGIDTLIKAIPDLAKKHKNIALVIMGSKWFSNNDVTDYIAYVRAMAERLPIPVIQTGFVSPDKIQEWFVASDVFVCTSRWQEPLARVHYEAMAAGLPIVTTNRGGNHEVIELGKNGFLVENQEDPDEFVKHLSYLLSNSDTAEEMGRYGRSLAERFYTWDRVVNDVAKVWEQEMEKPQEYRVPLQKNPIEENTKEDNAKEEKADKKLKDKKSKDKKSKDKKAKDKKVKDEISKKDKKKSKRHKDKFFSYEIK